MSAHPTVTVDLGKIEENTRAVVEALLGIQIVAVTKATCGDPRVAAAMLAGGASALGESRLENVERLRGAGIDAPMWLLRAPVPALAEETVRLTGVSLASELVTVTALDAACAKLGRAHSIVVMVDLGDLREGMMPDKLPGFLDAAAALEHVEIAGIGASLTCYGGIVPSQENLGLLAELAAAAEARLGRKLVVSGGSSTSLELAIAGQAPSAIDNLRIGEAIVLGVDPSTREPIPGLELHQDAIIASAPVIECKVKPSKPFGVATQDAFGNIPEFEDRGLRRRAILALGRQDAPPAGLRPLDPGVEVLGASSDHLIVDVEAMPGAPAIGDPLRFVPGYSATLQLFTSPYVVKEYVVG